LWYPIKMLRKRLALIFLPVLFASTILLAQQERQIPPPDDGQFGTKFFTQLRSIFGTFRDSDLQRVFQLAEPIQCNELVSGRGEWRPVAFFNDNRKLGDWFRDSIEEVRSDISVYIFKGPCRGDHGPVQLTTKFPVQESIDAFADGKIPIDRVDVNVNAPVSVVFDPRSGAYTFDLPYLFLVSHQATSDLFSLNPAHFGDRYATNVTDMWDCKAVSSKDITYRFMICRTSTAGRGPGSRPPSRTPSDGSSAYFILSDGSEAHSSVTLDFGDGDHPSAAAVPVAPPEPQGVIGWQAPTYKSQIVNVAMTEFRIRFSPETWMDRIGSNQVVSNQRIASLQTAKPADGADYCMWSPGDPSMLNRLLSDEPDMDVAFSVQGVNKGGGQPSSSITFLMKTHTGTRLGTLQCYFPRTDTADIVGYDRWSSIVGGTLKLEIRPPDSQINKN